MRVLIVYPHMSLYGGAELVIVKLANYLTKKGIKNSLLCLSALDEIKKGLKGTKLIVLKDKKPKKGGISKFLNFAFEILLLRKHVNKYRKDYDVINAHNFPAEYAVFPFVKNSVWTCNEPPMQLYHLAPNLSFPLKIVAWFVKIFDKFLVKNYVKYSVVADEFNAKRFEKIYGIKPEIINYGIDYEFFSKGNEERAREMFDLYNNFVLLQVGTLFPLKNQMESIKVVEKLKERIPNIKLVLAGGSEDYNYQSLLQQYVKKKKLDRHVIFTGHLPRKIIRDLNKACDIALFPIKSQGGWLSPFEILCAGKPVIVSKFITSSNIIKRNGIGIVTDDFAKVVMDIYNNKKKYRVMGERGKKWVKKNLSWDKFSERMLEVFGKV